MYVGLNVNTHYSCQILVKLHFCVRLSKNIQILNYKKICSLGAELFHTNRQTDKTKPTVTFRNSANVSKNWSSSAYNIHVWNSCMGWITGQACAMSFMIFQRNRI